MNNTALNISRADVLEFPRHGLTNRQIDNRLRKLADLESEKKRLEKEIDALKAEIKEAMNGAEMIETPNYIVRNTTVKTARFDSKSFKAAHPALYKEYTRETVSTRFSFKEV